MLPVGWISQRRRGAPARRVDAGLLRAALKTVRDELRAAAAALA